MKEEKIIELPNEHIIFESNKMEKFSIISTMVSLSLDRSQWEKDLYDTYISNWKRNVISSSFFPTNHNGKIALDVTSLESLSDIANFFEDKGFRISFGDCVGRIKREWIERDKERVHENRGEDFFQFFVHIRSKEEYFKFRELLLSKELKDIGYLIYHRVGESYGIYGDITKEKFVLV